MQTPKFKKIMFWQSGVTEDVLSFLSSPHSGSFLLPSLPKWTRGELMISE
jgi:hypothetical protein